MPELLGQGTTVYVMTAVGLGIIYGLPYLTKAVPSPLVTIVLLTAVSMYLGLGIHKVGDMGALPSELPWVALPQVPFTLDTLWIILPVSLTLTMVGLLESLMTASIVDEMTDTTSGQEPRMRGPGRGQHHLRLFWRHGRLRHDRAVGHQRLLRGTRTPLDTLGRGRSSCS